MADGNPPRRRGYVYADGIPATLSDELWAHRHPLPTFSGRPVPTPRLSPAVRAVWSEALAELEERHAHRVGAQVAAGVGSGLLLGGAVAATALGCSLQ